MPTPRLCILCQSQPATYPDRYATIGRRTKRICAECHRERLAGDINVILAQHGLASIASTSARDNQETAGEIEWNNY